MCDLNGSKGKQKYCGSVNRAVRRESSMNPKQQHMAAILSSPHLVSDDLQDATVGAHTECGRACTGVCTSVCTCVCTCACACACMSKPCRTVELDASARLGVML